MRKPLRTPTPPDDLSDLIPLREVGRHLPHRSGRALHHSTVYRWATRGVAGVRLQTLRAPGAGRCTTQQWLREFVAAVAALRDPPATSSGARTAATLARHGLRGRAAR